MNSVDFGRRRAQFVRSRRSYIQSSLTSQDSVDSDEDWDASSESAASIRSTRSLRSFKSWRRSQRQKRRNIKRVNSLYNDSANDHSMEALDLSGDFGRATEKSITKTGTDKQFNVSHEKANENEGTEVEIDATQTNILTTISQSPLEAYYSSSPLTTSEDSDGHSTPRRLSATHISETDETKDKDNRNNLVGIYKNRKDPLQRRSYPFIRQESDPQAAQNENSKSPNSLAPPSFFFGADRPRFLSAENSRGLNIVDSLDKTPSLLELAKLKSNSVEMEEQPENDEVFGLTREVVFAETNGFTVSLPTNSPTVPAHILAEESSENCAQPNAKKPQECENLNDAKAQGENGTICNPTQNDNPNDRTENNGGKGCSKQASMDEIRERYLISGEVDRSEQKALETDKGDYFLPPLIAKAIEKRTIMEENSAGTVGNTEPEPEATLKQNVSQNNIKRFSTLSTSTQDASDSENVYLENAEDIFQDLHETEFLLPPQKRALPESDTSSIETQESVDPIENILIREDDVSADKRTFTLNGRAVINPVAGNLVKEDSVEILAVEAAEAPIPENQSESVLFAEYKVSREKNEIVGDNSETSVHSHKVGNDKNCDVCGRKAKKMTEEEPEIIATNVDEVKASEQTNSGSLKDKPSVHSHRVGNDAGCEVCSSKDKKTDLSDAFLCCCIL